LNREDAMNDLAGRLLEQAPVYRLWQAPFADQKFAPVLVHNQMERVRRVLDVGCGPGTNAKYFTQAEYLGVDINPDYIQDARQRHRGEFVACDVRTYRPPAGACFDFVLVNSFLHHFNTSEVKSILLHLNTLLSADGRVHILELVMPQHASISRLLARWDRGKYARPLPEWQHIFSTIFKPVLFQSYSLAGLGLTLWNMIYFKGTARP
jgi:SAM-dependent methyltransferase